MFSFPTAIMILMGGFVGSKLAFNPEFSTLPIALVVVGTVSGIIPATFLMKKIGRKKGFVGASFYLKLFIIPMALNVNNSDTSTMDCSVSNF